MKLSTLNPFRLRMMLPGILVLGLLLGVWLGDLFKGFGWGPGQGGGPATGTNGDRGTGDSSGGTVDLVGVRTARDAEETLPVKDDEPESSEETGVVHVLIDGRDYYLLHGRRKERIALDELLRRIERAPPNDDGVKVMISYTRDSRPSAETKLDASLQDAGVPENAIYRAPKAVE